MRRQEADARERLMLMPVGYVTWPWGLLPYLWISEQHGRRMSSISRLPTWVATEEANEGLHQNMTFGFMYSELKVTWAID